MSTTYYVQFTDGSLSTMTSDDANPPVLPKPGSFITLAAYNTALASLQATIDAARAVQTTNLANKQRDIYGDMLAAGNSDRGARNVSGFTGSWPAAGFVASGIQQQYAQAFSDSHNFANLTVPTAQDTTIDTLTYTFTNPDPGRSMNLYVWVEIDVTVTLAAGTTAEVGQGTLRKWALTNGGSTTMTNQHCRTGRLTRNGTPTAPGATSVQTITVSAGRGSAGATYSNVSVDIRGFWFPA